MRKRSFHSSVTCWFAPHTKESSIDTPTFETLDSTSLKPVRKVKPVKVAKRAGVTTIVKESWNNLEKMVRYILYWTRINVASRMMGNYHYGSEGSCYTLTPTLPLDYIPFFFAAS
jgi:hypothetical protein